MIGVDELSIRKGQHYRIIVSDLERARPIWVGGSGRTEADLDRFFTEWRERKTRHLELAVMDMWKPFRTSVEKNVPTARIVYDKFHIMRHLGDALDQVRRHEYHRLAGQDRSFIKGQRYTLLAHRAHLTLNGRRALAKLFKPTSGSARPICSRSPSASSGTTGPRAGHVASSSTGATRSNGSGSNPTCASPR